MKNTGHMARFLAAAALLASKAGQALSTAAYTLPSGHPGKNRLAGPAMPAGNKLIRRCVRGMRIRGH